MQKRWEITDPNLELSSRVARDHGISAGIAQILVNRSLVEPEAIRQFLRPSLAFLPDPETMQGMREAVQRLITAIRHKEKITIYGDYDVDGTTATTLLVCFFREVGAEVDFYIPHRMREGYSLNVEALRTLQARGTKVLITVDNGISAVNEAAAAKQLGIDLIITDHHEVPEQVPEACAVLNPKQKNDAFPGKELAGVGVAFYLAIGLRKALRDAGMLGDREPNLRALLDLVAVGTISDMAPLTGINRILVKEGLKVLSHSPRTGLKALIEVASLGGEISADQIAFRVGPRINAAGRLDDAALGVNLLLTDQAGAARQLAEKLNAANLERQDLEDQIVKDAVALIESQGIAQKFRSLVVKGEDWHQGVIGIVASRLVEKYYLPTIVLTKDRDGLKGSARSIRKFHLVEALGECRALLSRFGGHRYAAGLSMKPEKYSELVEQFDKIVRTKLASEDFSPALRIDARSELDWIDAEFLAQIDHLEPFGLGNPEPAWFLERVEVRESRIVGEKHLRLKVGAGRRHFGVIGFRLADKQPAVGSKIDLAFSPEWNEWNGNKSIQLRAIDLRPSI